MSEASPYSPAFARTLAERLGDDVDVTWLKQAIDTALIRYLAMRRTLTLTASKKKERAAKITAAAARLEKAIDWGNEEGRVALVEMLSDQALIDHGIADVLSDAERGDARAIAIASDAIDKAAEQIGDLVYLLRHLKVAASISANGPITAQFYEDIYKGGETALNRFLHDLIHIYRLAGQTVGRSQNNNRLTGPLPDFVKAVVRTGLGDEAPDPGALDARLDRKIEEYLEAQRRAEPMGKTPAKKN